MRKYNALWKYVQQCGDASFKLTFDEIGRIAGVPIDHSFLISMKEQTVLFSKMD